MFKRLLALSLALLLPATALAQEDDRGRLIRLIESQLSDGAERQVRIDGFRGALSAEAELDRLTISDADGAWLILEDARLNWRRAALLRGALEVEALTAEQLTLVRPPNPPDGPDLPAPEATPFALPELPVRINIGEFAVRRVELGEAFLGEPAALSVTGMARLADGSGSADLRVERLDATEGVFTLDAGFSNETRILDIDLLLQEAAGGLVAEALDLPGAPPVRLEIAGEGPIDDIEVQVALDTDGTRRLDGTVRTAPLGDDGGQRIDIDVAGDLSPLMAPEFRPFFGTDTALAARIEREASGATRLEDMRLASAALRLEGDVVLDSANRPALIDVTGRIAAPDGARTIRLPVGGTNATLGSADLEVRFDASEGETFTVASALTNLSVDDIDIQTARIDTTGRIVPSDTGIAAVTADVAAVLNGLDHTDPALAAALGQAMTIETDIAWAEEAPLELRNIVLAAGSLSARGAVEARLDGASLPATFDLTARIGDLSRFSALSGQDLSGAIALDLDGSAEVLSGAFDIELTGRADNLGVSPAVPPALLAGQTDLRLAAVRDSAGTRIETLTVDGRQISLQAAGDVSSTEGTLSARARLADLGLLTNAVRGPATVEADLSRAAEGWAIDAGFEGPAGLRGSLDGLVGLDGGAVDLASTGSIPLVLANRFIAPRSVAGTMTFDLALRGQPGLDALSGRLTTSGARLSAPTFRLALEDIGLTAALQGGRMTLDGGGNVSTGGRVGLSGTVDLRSPGLPGDLALTLDSVRLVDPSLYEVLIARGDLAVSGPLAAGPRVAGTVDLGPSELRVPETGLGSAAPIPPITHVGETPAERQTRAAAGLLDQGAGGGAGPSVGLDLQINAPGRIFLRGRGIDAEFGGAIRIAGTSNDVIPSGRFDLIRGRISVLGTRLDITEGAATLQGDFDPFLRLRAESRAGAYRIFIDVDGPASAPDISLSSDPFLPEDEILAQLLFGRSVSALSPVQLLQLADAASGLAGGGSGGGILSNLRDGLGLDDLDIQTDEEGNAAVRAGRYLSDNVYTDVTIGAAGESELSLNIDLTPDITARGSFSSEGSSSVGVFFERDY